MFSYRSSATLAAIAGAAMMWLGSVDLAGRNDFEYMSRTTGAENSWLLVACGATILFVGMGALALSFNCRKAVSSKHGYVMRPSWVVITLFCAAATTTVAAAALAASIVLSGRTTGDGAWIVLIAGFFGLISLAVLATAVSALLGKAWYPSIRSENGSTLDVRTFGSRRTYHLPGTRLIPAEKTGVLIEGKPIAIQRGLVVAVLDTFFADRDRSGISTIRTNEANLRAFTAGRTDASRKMDPK